MANKGTVIKEHRSNFPTPLILKMGDHVAVKRKESQWEGWLWCTDKDNNRGWVPENILKITGTDAVVLSDYNATELDVNEGDSLILIFQESGWCWCRRSNGQEGWVPVENIQAEK